MENTQTKTCSKCGRTLPIEDFYKRSNGQIFTSCKECVKVINSARRITPPIRKIPSRHTLRDS